MLLVYYYYCNVEASLIFPSKFQDQVSYKQLLGVFYYLESTPYKLVELNFPQRMYNNIDYTMLQKSVLDTQSLIEMLNLFVCIIVFTLIHTKN